MQMGAFGASSSITLDVYLMVGWLMYHDLAQNLKRLCSYYDSIAQVCRELNINRTQFNRYLTGQYKPSASTLRRICDFFGVEEHELLMPASQFERLIQVKPQVTQKVSEGRAELSHLQMLQKASHQQIDKYLGYYFEYYLSMAVPGKILRNLICIERQSDGVFYQRTERLREIGEDAPFHSKYLGVALFLTDRIFMADYESLATNEVTETILTPSYKNRIGRLNGLRLGVPASGMRTPSCARVVMEYLGTEVNVRKALAMCGLYSVEDPAIDESIVESVRNDMAEGDWHFKAHT
jgi:transcriptional regulator with XRE-family HTH domain